MEAVNCYHKELHLVCCSRPRSASVNSQNMCIKVEFPIISTEKVILVLFWIQTDSNLNSSFFFETITTLKMDYLNELLLPNCFSKTILFLIQSNVGFIVWKTSASWESEQNNNNTVPLHVWGLGEGLFCGTFYLMQLMFLSLLRLFCKCYSLMNLHI